MFQKRRKGANDTPLGYPWIPSSGRIRTGAGPVTVAAGRPARRGSSYYGLTPSSPPEPVTAGGGKNQGRVAPKLDLEQCAFMDHLLSMMVSASPIEIMEGL